MAGLTQGYAGVDGEVMYGNIASKKELKELEGKQKCQFHNEYSDRMLTTTLYFENQSYHAGQIVFNADDESHFPNLQVGRTLDFALANSTPARKSRVSGQGEDDVPAAREVDESAKASLLDIFGLAHTKDTKVGDQYVRGVSGGERKRVSLAEVLARRSSIQLWDKPSRGLDASTALEYTKIMRVLADVENKAIAVSLYQAGNAIYKQFDKVLVLAEGQCIYYGRRADAQAYFEDLGLEILGKQSMSFHGLRGCI